MSADFHLYPILLDFWQFQAICLLYDLVGLTCFAQHSGAFTVATEADSYDSGSDFEYEGKHEGKFYVPTSKPNLAPFLYSSIPHNLCLRVSVAQDDTAFPSSPHSNIACNHSTPQSSPNLVGDCTIKLPKHVMALLQNPPAHLIAIHSLPD